MNKEEIKEKFQRLGLSEDKANYYTKCEMNDDLAWLSAFRFVRPLNKNLEFYKNEYGNKLKNRFESGLDNLEVETELLKKGATPELLGQFALHRCTTHSTCNNI